MLVFESISRFDFFFFFFQAEDGIRDLTVTGVQTCALPILSQALGIIEIGLPCINLTHAREKPASVGNLLPAYEMRQLDLGYGDGLREISFRGPGFLDAYYSPWTPRSQIATDGWFETHDVGLV